MKRVLLFIIITAITSVVYAQKGHYFYTNIGGGIHNLNYKLGSNGGKTPGLGFSGGLGWQWFFSEHFGMGVGASFNTIKTTGKLNCALNNGNFTDSENGLEYTSNILFNNLKEVDKQSVIDIQLSFYYQTPLSERWRLLIGINGFYTTVLSQSYKIKNDGGNVSTGKYFPIYDLDFSGFEAEEHGLISMSDFSGDTRLKKSLFGLGSQVQMAYALGKKRRVELTFGIYGAYRFSDQKDGVSAEIIDAETLEYKGITQSTLSDKVSSSNLGGSVGLRFHIGGKEKPKREEPEPEPQPEPKQVVQNEPEPQPEPQSEPEQVVQNEPEPQPEEPQQVAEVIDSLPPIQMNLNSTEVDSSISNTLDVVADKLKSHPDTKILITGHTCDLGTLEVNQQLGLERAEAVKRELLRRGVNPVQMQTESRWWKEPLVPNTTEENRKKNRRVEIEVIK